MEWINPKTDWNQSDRMNAEDYNRIKNNLAYLHELGTNLYSSFSIEEMGEDKDVKGHYFASEFNILENNLEVINQNTFPREYGDKQTFADNGPFIAYGELNRIEKAMLMMYETLASQKQALGRLPMTLGIKKIGGI